MRNNTTDILKAFIFCLLISVFVVMVWFYQVPKNEFLFMHDQLLHLSKGSVLESFFIRSSSNLGVANGLTSILSFWQLILYYFLYTLGFGIRATEIISFSFYLFSSLFFSYLGFKGIKNLFEWQIGNIALYLAAVFYTFNTYTLVILHTGNYSANFALTYALFPLTVYYFAKIIENRVNFRDLVLLATIMFIMSFYLSTFGVVTIFIICALFIGVIGYPRNFKPIVKNLAILGLLLMPLASYVIITTFYEFLNIQGAVNKNPINTYTMLQGGVLYPIVMRFSWAIYNSWEGKSIFTYDKFFFNPFVNLSYFTLYAVLIFFILRKKLSGVFLYIIVFFLVVSLFLAKAAQYPFGDFYLFLYNNVPFFNIFRSPYSKFGMGIILTLAILFLYYAQYFKSRFILVFFLLMIITQSYPLLNGSALIGKGLKNGVDRSIQITKSYEQLNEKITSDGMSNITVLVLPPNLFGNFKTADGFNFIGQDPLRKITNANLVYLNSSFGIYRDVFENIEQHVEGESIDLLREMGISHVLLRKDVVNPNYKLFDDSLFKDLAQLEYKDSQFILYKFKNVEPLVQGENVSYRRISPVKYSVYIKNYKPGQEIKFLNSYHKGWGVYVNLNQSKLCRSGDLNCKLFLKPIEPADIKHAFDTPVGQHVESKTEFFNVWKIDGNVSTDQDGSASFVLYFKPQAYSYIGLIISFAILVIYAMYITIPLIYLKKKR